MASSPLSGSQNAGLQGIRTVPSTASQTTQPTTTSTGRSHEGAGSIATSANGLSDANLVKANTDTENPSESYDRSPKESDDINNGPTRPGIGIIAPAISVSHENGGSSQQSLERGSVDIPASPSLSSVSYDSASFSTTGSLVSPLHLNLAVPYSGSSNMASNNARRASSSNGTSLFSLRRDLSALGFNQSTIGTNAIATILNSPQGPSNSSSYTPTTRDIPPVVLTNLNIVPPQEFEPYINTVSSEFERYNHLRGIKSDTTESVNLAPPSTRSNVPARTDSLASAFAAPTFFDILESRLMKYVGGPSNTASSARPPDERPPERPRRSRRQKSVAMTPLSTIPQVYFEQNFKLENPRIFDVVSERSEILASSTPQPAASPVSSTATSSSATLVSQPEAQPSSIRKSLANNAILQEKLSWYLDTVEVHLIDEISKASPSFFAALGDLRNLHTETANAVDKIAGLREDLRRVDKEQAQIGLEIVRLQKRRENVARLQQATDQMALVSEAARDAERLWREGNPDGCWNATFKVDKIIEAKIDLAELQAEKEECRSWKFPLSVLSTVPAIDSVRDQLRALRARVANEYQARFAGCLIEDIRRHMASVPTQDTLDRLSRTYTDSKVKLGSGATLTPSGSAPPPINTSYMNVPEKLKPEVRSHLEGLAKIGAVESGVQRYRDAIMREVKNIIKRNLPTNANDDTASVASSNTGRTTTTAQKSASLERMLREMQPQEFEDMLVDIYTAVSELLRRLSMHQKLLLDITASMDTILDISDLIMAAADITQVRSARIINVRRDLNTLADPTTFSSFYNLNRVFLAECEAITGKFGNALLSTVMAQQPQPPAQTQARLMQGQGR
ncbi:hypothetical protein V1525DRAFT_344442 [Lipomyces kononenkoae]|uniref:Uncharacterized protein n=1 Tax=Lipomyces kononenkoae TaxID=34357 RepID=A0ACC3SZY4_LIPKO